MNQDECLKPLLVNGMGRSGSTLTMQLLGTDPACVFDNIYPLESRYLSLITQYAAQWAGWTFAEYGPTSTAFQTIVGNNPTVMRKGKASDGLIGIPSYQEILSTSWSQFSKAVKRENPGARFYAEKVVAWVPAFLTPHLDFYAIYTIRDPRDLFISVNAFNAKRGYLGFGRHESDSDLDYALTICHRFLHRNESYKIVKESGAAVSLAKYEDLATNPMQSLLPLSEATGLKPQPLANKDSFAHHRTSDSLEESIGRWKHESIGEDVLDTFERVLFADLKEVGYETLRKEANDLDLNFTSANGRKAESHILDLTNGVLIDCAQPGINVAFKGVPQYESSIEFTIDLSHLQEAADILEVWICVSGFFGGQCTISLLPSNTVLQQAVYDAGSHCTTLRFKSPMKIDNSTRIKLQFVHTGLAIQNSNQTLNLRRINLIAAGQTTRPLHSSQKLIDTNEVKSGRKLFGSVLSRIFGTENRKTDR